jgi:hypothetical protein
VTFSKYSVREESYKQVTRTARSRRRKKKKR